MDPVGPRKPGDEPKEIILHMLRIGAVQRFHDPLAHGLVDIQELSKTHEAISGTRTRHRHHVLTPYRCTCRRRNAAIRTRAEELLDENAAIAGSGR